MDEITKFMTETYPRLWHIAYDLGVKARDEGMPRICNLIDPDFITPAGNILKPYKSAWEQGWDRRTMPAIFGQIEAALDKMPMRPCTIEDYE